MLNGVQLGPLDETQTRALPLTPQTPVWSEGFADWTPAGEVAAFADMFGGGPTRPYNGTNTVYGQGTSPSPSNPGYAPGSSYNYSDMPEMPPTYLAWSIIVTLLCCLPLGIVAIVCSASVSSAYNRGDYRQALRQSNNARNWIIASVITGLIGSGLYLMFFMPLALFV